MKDDQLSRFVELAVLDLGEMKPFADFLKKRILHINMSVQVTARFQTPVFSPQKG